MEYIGIINGYKGIPKVRGISFNCYKKEEAVLDSREVHLLERPSQQLPNVELDSDWWMTP